MLWGVWHATVTSCLTMPGTANINVSLTNLQKHPLKPDTWGLASNDKRNVQFKCSSFTNQNSEKPVWFFSPCAAYETTPSRPHLALFTCLFLLMSFLGVAMYCTDRRRPQRVCEELEAALAVYLLHMKQLLWGCWIWLTMQWLLSTTGGDMEPLLIYYKFSVFFRSLFFLSLKVPGPTNTSAIWQGSTHCLWFYSTLTMKQGKCVIPEICSFHVCMYICTKVVGMPLHI